MSTLTADTTGMSIWIIRDGQRSIKGTLVEQLKGGWLIKEKRKSHNDNLTPIELPLSSIMSEAEYHAWKQQKNKKRSKDYEHDTQRTWQQIQFEWLI